MQHTQTQKMPSGSMIAPILRKQLSPLTYAALRFCCLSFLNLPSGRVLLIACPNDDAMYLLQCTQLVELAWVLQQQFGKTCICLHHVQKGLIMHWDGEQLSRRFLKKL